MMKYKLYKDKLISIKKEMVNIHHRSTALKVSIVMNFNNYG